MIKKLTINRKLWLRNSLFGELRSSSSGLQCCLGFLAKECGLTNEQITGITDFKDYYYYSNKLGNPDNFVKKLPPQMWFDSYQTDLVKEIINTNDNIKINDKERETKLKELFSLAEIELEFVG